MSDKLYGLRTISRIGIYRQALSVSNTPILLPIPIVSAPTTATLNPNEQEQELFDINCRGEEVVGATVTQGFKPQLELVFPEGLPEMDSFIHGRLMESQDDVVGRVFAEFQTVPGQTTVAARTATEVGYEVEEQAARTNSGFYYIDPETKLAKELALIAVSGTPANDQISIGDNLAIEYSPELAAKAVTIRGWVPCTFATATVISSAPLGILSVFAQGVDFGGRAAMLSVQNAQRIPGGQISREAERQVNLRILPDPNDGNGLGYQMRYLDKKIAC